jgi:ankyrin repeat protein
VADRVAARTRTRPRSDNTPLHCAALAPSSAAAAALLAAGADAAAEDEDGDTPLHEACRWAGRGRHIAALLAHGAEMDAENCCGWTPLHCAAAYGREGTARALLAAGAHAAARTSEGATPAALAKGEALQALLHAAAADAGADADREHLTYDGCNAHPRTALAACSLIT